MLKNDIILLAIWPCKIWSLAGFPTYKYLDKNFQYFENKLFLLPILGIIGNIVVLIKYTNIKYDIDKYMFYSQIFSVHISVLVSLVFSYYKKHKIKTILNKMLTASNLLKKISKDHTVSIKRKDLTIYAIVQIFLVMVVVYSSILRARYLELESIIRTYCFLSIQGYRYVIGIMFLYILAILKQLYYILYTMIENSKKSKQIPVLNFIKMIFYLRNISLEIKSAFQIQVLFKLFSDFITSIPLLFYYMQSMSEESTPFLFILFKTFGTCLWGACTLVSTFTVAFFLEKIGKLDARALEQLDEVSDNSPLSSYKEVKIF